MMVQGGVWNDAGDWRCTAVKVVGESFEELYGAAKAWAKKCFPDWNRIDVMGDDGFFVEKILCVKDSVFVAGKVDSYVKYRYQNI